MILTEAKLLLEKMGKKWIIKPERRQKPPMLCTLLTYGGIPLAMSNPISGNHHDLFNIGVHFEEVTLVLEKSNILLEGLFVNFDAGFDSEKLRKKTASKGIIANICPNRRNKNSEDDKEYYFDATVSSWIGFNYLAFIVLGLEKFRKIKKQDEFCSL